MSNLKRKKLSFAILDILRKYTDEDHRLSQKDIIDILKTEYDMTADRKSVKRNITSLMEMGYEINFSEALRMFPNKDGVLEESYILSDFWLEREFTDSELRLLIDSLLFSKHIPYSQCKGLVDKLRGLSNQYCKSRSGLFHDAIHLRSHCPAARRETGAGIPGNHAGNRYCLGSG